MLLIQLLMFSEVSSMTYVEVNLLTSDTEAVTLNSLIIILSVSNLLEDHLDLIIS